MAFSRLLFFFFFFFIASIILISSIPNSSASLDGTHMSFILPSSSSTSSCLGSVEDCLLDSEFELDSESSRRILATKKYISYGALQKNNVPCSRRGASYYNCRPGAQANPYSRGCSAITRCRR